MIIVAVYLNTKLFLESDKDYTISLYLSEIAQIPFDQLRLVAKLNLMDTPINLDIQDVLEIAYHATQNSTYYWCQHPEVETVNFPQRSTSVGDVFEVDGRYWAIAQFGFVEIYPRVEVGND